MHLEAQWGDPHQTVWSWGHPTQQAACQRPSVSHGEGEAPQESPFPQQWMGMPGCTKAQHNINQRWCWSGLHMVAVACQCHPAAATRDSQLLQTWGDISSALLVLAGATGSRTRPSRQLTAEGVGKKGKGPEMKLPSLIHSPQKPSQKSAKVQWLKSALRKPKVLNKFIDGQ